MAITSIDSAIAGMQWPRFIAKSLSGTLVAGRPFSYWRIAGGPGAGSNDATLNGVVLSSSSAQVSGQIPFTNPATGNAYLARFSATSSQAGVVILADRLWHNGGFTITSTAAQNIVSPTWPARDALGTTNGEGVLLAVEVSAATGAGVPTITISYTNQDGVAGRTATNVVATVAASAIGTTYFIGLQSGDTGVRSVQSLRLSATWTSGTINLVAYRPLAFLELALGNVPASIDALTAGFPRLYDGSVPYLMLVPSTTTSTNLIGQIIFTHG